MDWRYNTIWQEQLSGDDLASVNFGNGATSDQDLLEKGYLFAAKFKSQTGNLDDFPAGRSVKCLYLGSSNIRSFSGLSKFPNIKRLETEYCNKLEIDSGLSDARGTLEWLHINQSKRFSPGEELFSLHNLRVLCLNACGPIKDLEFLRRLPNLVDFRFVDTNVLSGDLTPLLEHPTLCSAGFLNKRHYNLKESEADEYFRPRREAAIEKIYKGKYETFRYLSLGS